MPLRENPYSLWLPYDKLGFGAGFGRSEGGHTLERAWIFIKYSLQAYGTGNDLLGWGDLWWVFIPIGAWAVRRRPGAWLLAGVLPATVLAYVPYWIGSWQYGPRYYYEGMLSISLLSAAGIVWLVRRGHPLWKGMILVGVGLLLGRNLVFYLPERLAGMRDMYGIHRAMLAPFSSSEARELAPALVIFTWQDSWTDYGGLLELQNAQLTSPFVFALNRGNRANTKLSEAFPERRLVYYYPDEPFHFYDSPR